MQTYERLGPLDASFLYWESNAELMVIGGVCIYEDPGRSIDEIREHIRARLDRVPRLRQKLMWVPFGQGHPVWIDDPDFDIDLHVRHTGLPRNGDYDELYALFAETMSRPLERTRPLWEVWIVDFPDDVQAMIVKVHHSLVDGISGLAIASAFLDTVPDAQPTRPNPWEATPPPSAVKLFGDSLFEIGRRWTTPGGIGRALKSLPNAPADAASEIAETARGIGHFARRVIESVPETSLTAGAGEHRRYFATRADLNEVKAIKSHFGFSVNDVVLAAVTGGLRDLLAARGEELPDRNLRAAVPVSMRADSDETSGNQVAIMLVDLPVGEPDAATRLELVHAHQHDAKTGGESSGTGFLLDLERLAPPALLSLIGRIIHKQWVMNLVVTNVAGPRFPFYFMGGRVLDILPYAPLVGSTSIAVGVLSYEDHLTFALTGDWDTRDLGVFAAGIDASLEQLSAAVEAVPESSEAVVEA